MRRDLNLVEIEFDLSWTNQSINNWGYYIYPLKEYYPTVAA